ncbi:MAG: C25 family cysteine peptidase [Candidatus Zixiibacteriota bacterium]
MKIGSIALAACLAFCTVAANADYRDTLEFSLDAITYDAANGSIHIDGLENIDEANRPSVPVFSYTLSANSAFDGNGIVCRVLEADTISLPVTIAKNLPDIPTSEAPLDIVQPEILKSNSTVYPAQTFLSNNQKNAEYTISTISIFPVQFMSESKIIVNRKIEVIANDNTAALTRGVPDLSVGTAKSDGPSLSSSVSGVGGCPVGIDYVVVTSSSLSSSFDRFIDLKNRSGFSAAIADIDSIVYYYPGLDDAESLREYLKDFYQFGGRYVLLGGDEHVVPIRYAYFYNTISQPALADLMICDLYFADLTGNWDTDFDGVYGEPTQDQPDMGMELFVGRLPFSRPEQVTAYTSKLESYQFNPGNGDAAYLDKSIFFTSDQMRDYFEGGQQYEVAAVFPQSISTECELLAEHPSGDAPSPTGPFSSDAVTALDNGYGLVNVLAHGRADGFVVSSNEYNQFPKSYLLTGESNASGNNFSDIAPTGKAAFYYSICCSQATLDLETLYGQTVPSAVEELVAMNNAGAVGMVAFSRWGWVGSSYKLMQSFYAHLFGDAAGNPVLAMQYSWLDYPYYRDQIYGQGYYGDPSLIVYTALPNRVQIASDPVYQPGTYFEVTVSAGSAAVAGQAVTISSSKEYITVITDDNGVAAFTVPQDWNNDIKITVYASGSISTVATVPQSIIADVDDDENQLPLEFALNQNYPNPFNPTTTISFTTTQAGDVSLQIFNILGELVAEPVNKHLPAGEHEAIWAAVDRNGSGVASGIYFYRLVSEEGVQTRKMTLIK